MDAEGANKEELVRDIKAAMKLGSEEEFDAALEQIQEKHKSFFSPRECQLVCIQTCCGVVHRCNSRRSQSS